MTNGDSAHLRPESKSFVNSLAGLLLYLFGKSQPKATAGDLKQADFPTSTQRLGMVFTERIRDIFRFRWVRRNTKA
jgi:hypothetical protein